MSDFSTEELRSIVAFCQEKAAEIETELHHDVKRLAADAIYQMYLSIARKAYVELIDRDFREEEGGKKDGKGTSEK